MKLGDQELYDLVLNVNKAFYDQVYEHEWLKPVFKNIKQEIIETQQTDFIVGALGGPKRYGGRNPQDAHPHIYVDEDMWQLREDMLVKAFEKVNAPAWIRERWLKIDNAFKQAIIKKSPDECKKRYFTDEIIVVPNPKHKKSA